MRAKGRWKHHNPPRGERNPRCRLTMEDILDIRCLATCGTQYKTIGERYGLTPAYVGEIVRRQAWSHVA